MRIVAIVQARMTSTRLPGKVMLPILGEPMLAWVIERLQKAKTLEEIVVATTTDPEDNVIEKECIKRGYKFFRGDREDVLDRYFQAAKQYQADVIVRVTSDCPLLDPGIVDACVTEFIRLQPDCDYLSNALEIATFPLGLDVEVFHRSSLQKAHQLAEEKSYREHVTAFIYHHPDQFRLIDYRSTSDDSDLRWTVDTPEDYQLVQRIAERVGNKSFAWMVARDLCRTNPDWLEINRSIVQKTVDIHE